MSQASDNLPPYIQDAGQPFSIVPPQASTSAAQVDLLGLGLLIFCVAVTMVVVGLVLFFGIRYRAGSRVQRKSPAGHAMQLQMEVIWAVALFVVFMGFFYWGTAVYLNLYRVPEDALTIDVVGKQWMWKFEHPNGAREINTLHVPTGRKVRLDITSQDVIHSFYIPAFRIKHDAVPGLESDLWFEATQVGVYRMFCAEYCGTEHSYMRGRVVVMTPEDYSDWLAANGHEQTPALSGKQLFMTYGCSGCHMGKAAVDAPKLAGIYGRQVPLADGTTVIADEAYIRDSILLPDKQIVAGYQPIMPSYAGQMSEGDLQKIIAYIRSLDADDWLSQTTGAAR